MCYHTGKFSVYKPKNLKHCASAFRNRAINYVPNCVTGYEVELGNHNTYF